MTTMESVLKTSKHATKEMIDFQLSDEARRLYTRNMENNTYKSDIQKRNVEEVGNFRPICTLPALSRLFSTLIHNRLYDRLDRAQLEDQGGFRRSYQALDHLATYRLLEQQCQEWSVKMWVATVDFMKAFDSTSHRSLWNALEKCGIEPQYISLLRRLYAEQKATVLTDKESDMFEIKRGRTQGDPLSSLLFNTVLQMALCSCSLRRWSSSQK